MFDIAYHRWNDTTCDSNMSLLIVESKIDFLNHEFGSQLSLRSILHGCVGLGVYLNIQNYLNVRNDGMDIACVLQEEIGG